MAKPISYKKKLLKYPDGGLIPDLNFLNKDFKKWDNEEKKLYQYLKYNHIIEPNKEIEDYITENRKQYRDIQDKLSKERESFYKTNPNATPNDFEKYAEPKGLYSDWDAFIPNLYLNNDAYDKYYGEGYKAVFYDLNQQYNPQKYLGLKSKDEYKEYLQSDKYKDIAKKFWGDDSDKFVQKQLTDIDNAQYKSFKESNIHDQLELAPGRLAAYNPIYNTINMYQGNMRKVIPHEISHLTNRNENPLSEDEAYEFKQLSPNGLIQRIPKQITDEQKKRLEMSSQFSKWKDLSNEFRTQFDKNASPEYKQYPDAIDQLADPNEVRARVNAIRSELNRKNIKWNNTGDIENYINTLPDTDEIKVQYRDLNYIDKDLKNKLFNEYAYQKANSNKSLFTAKHGGYIKKYFDGGLLTEDPYKKYYNIQQPKSLAESPAWRAYTYAKGPSYSPIHSKNYEGVAPYTRFDDVTGFNYIVDPQTGQPFGELNMEGDNQFNLIRFLVNPYTGQDQTKDLGYKKDMSWENPFPQTENIDEQKGNIFKDLYTQNLIKYKGDRDAAYNASTTFMKNRIEPLFEGAWYDYNKNPNIPYEDKLRINPYMSSMSVDPKYTKKAIDDDLMRKHIDKVAQEHGYENLEKYLGKNYQEEVRKSPEYKQEFDKAFSALQDYYIKYKGYNPNKAKEEVYQGLYNDSLKKHGGYIHNNMAGKLNKRKGLPTRFPMYYTGGTPEMYMGTSDYFDKQNQLAGQNAAITNLAAQGLSFVPGWGQAASVALKAGQAASNLVGQKDMYGVSPTGFQQAAAATLDPLGTINSLVQGQNPYAYKKMLGEEGKLATSYGRGKTAEQQDAYTQQMKAAEGQYMAMGGYMPMYAPGGIMNPTNPIREPSAWIGKDYYKTAKGNYRDYGFIKAPQSGYYTRDNEYFTLEPANTLGDYGMFAAVDPTKPTPTINPNIIPNTTTATTTVKKPQFSWKQVDPWDLEKRYNEMAKKGMIEIKEDKGKTYIKRLYAMGGRMTNPYSGEPNAEIEGEVVSHSNGGIQDFSHLPNHEQATPANEVNLAEGSKILSKRITDPLTGKKFATVGKKYSTSREENVLNNNRLPELSNRSAKLSLMAKKKAFDDVFERHEATKVFNDAQKAENEATEDFIGMLGGMYGKGGLIKRKDGSYSPRGLWDNIRANRGSGKKPTKAMLEQERKIKTQEKAMGGYMYAEGGSFNNPGFKALPKYVQAKIKGNYADGGTYVTAGDEYHRIYKNAEGDIMVNHPKEDKGKWDTINLTDKAGAKTVKQGVAATKKWHRENPYAYGGYMNMYEAGGYVLGESYDMSEEELQELKNQGYTFDIE